jgi:hypothetical protein
MTRPKRTRKDLNHNQIVTELRALGAVVWDTADLGGRVLDTIVFFRGQVKAVEIKQPGKADDLTPDEWQSVAELQTVGVQPVIATSTEDVLRAFGALR